MADLITVVEYKDAEGLRGEKDDDRLNVIVPQVSDLVKKYCGISFIDFYSTDKVETFSVDDNYTTTIIVSESPLVEVSKVEERIPPITTVAKGLCTSAPVLVLSAMGKKPSAATKATINIGRSLSIAPL